MKLTIRTATDGTHKYVAVFESETSHKTIPFGAKGMSDYTQHHDKLRRQRYLTRHRARESWNNPQTAGALSRHLLWGDSTSFQTNLQSFKRRFSLQ